MSVAPTRCRRSTLAAAWLAAVLGCGGPADADNPAVTDPDVARRAVEAALRDWREGKPAGPVDGGVRVVDTHRKAGQVLRESTVLGEVDGDARRTFAARLVLDGPAERRVVRYVVFGREPVWVFRLEDFALMMHWDHPMPAESPAPGT